LEPVVAVAAAAAAVVEGGIPLAELVELVRSEPNLVRVGNVPERDSVVSTASAPAAETDRLMGRMATLVVVGHAVDSAEREASDLAAKDDHLEW